MSFVYLFIFIEANAGEREKFKLRSTWTKNFTWKIVGNGCRVNQQVEAVAILFNFKSSWRNLEEVDFKNLTLLLVQVYCIYNQV